MKRRHNAKKVLVLLCCVMASALVARGQESPPTSEEARESDTDKEQIAQPSDTWSDGDVVAITGVIWRSRLANVRPASQVLGRYIIKSDTDDQVYLKSADIDKLAEGTKLSAKGTVEYIRDEGGSPEICYINVSHFTQHDDAVGFISAAFKRAASTGARLDEGAFLAKHVLKSGMSRSEVLEILGDPDGRDSEDTQWSYITFYGTALTVKFLGDKMVVAREY